MLQHVYERASQARYLSKLIIATDDERIYKAARSFGAPVLMTRADHLSGNRSRGRSRIGATTRR